MTARSARMQDERRALRRGPLSAQALGMAFGLLTCVAIGVAFRRARSISRDGAVKRPDPVDPLPGDLLMVLAHELRTPLHSIVGWTRVLQAGAADAAVTASALDSIASSARAQSRLIEDVVDMLRSRRNEMPLRLDVLDLRSPVRNAIEVVRPSAESANLFVSAALPAEPCRVCGDGERLQQALGNVLANAVKFTRTGGIHVALVRRQHQYEIHIADTGKGIDRDFLPLVFTRFRQATRSGGRHHGLGLGLAIARDLVERHQGHISVTSRGRDQGTNVVVTLPALEDAPSGE